MNDYQNWFTRPDSPAFGMNPRAVHSTRPDMPGEVGGKQRVARRHVIAELARKENMTPTEAQSLFEQLPSLGGDYVLPRGESEEVRPELQGAYEHAERHGFAKPGSGDSVQHYHDPTLLPSGGPAWNAATLAMTHRFEQKLKPVFQERSIPAGSSRGTIAFSADQFVHDSAGNVRRTSPEPTREFPTAKRCV